MRTLVCGVLCSRACAYVMRTHRMTRHTSERHMVRFCVCVRLITRSGSEARDVNGLEGVVPGPAVQV